MGKITDITPQKGNKKRVSVFIDGSFFCGLDELTAAKYRLKIGQEIDEDELAKAQADSEYRTALDKALSYLSVRARSKKEMRDYLKGKGYLGATIKAAEERLTELGYLDDYKYAQRYILENKAYYGAYRLKLELKKRGVSTEIIDELIEGEDFDEEAINLVRSLWRSCGGDKRKIKDRMLRKGYGYDEIARALENSDEE